MENEQPKKKYPILAVRMSSEELAFIRGEADKQGMKLSKYVRKILLSLFSPSNK